MIRKEKFAPGEYYHVFSKTVLGVPEFKERDNSYKLAQTFLLANSTKSGQAFEYLRTYRNTSIKKALEIARSGERLVSILCYAIMPNHYHLLIKEIRENGITDFIRRGNTSIAKYVNIKQERSGPLFESRFKSKHIDSNDYLLHLSVYIHLNPLDFLSSRSWRENKIQNWEKEKKKLLEYRWSSLRHYINPKGSTMSDIEANIITETKIITDQFENEADYEKFLKEWSVESLGIIKDINLE